MYDRRRLHPFAILLSTFILLALCSNIIAQDPRPPRPRASTFGRPALPAILLEPVDRSQPTVDRFVLKKMRQRKLVGVAIGTVVDGQIDYLRGYGFEDREDKIGVKSRATMFRWASVAKTLAGIAALKLAQGTAYDLDAPIFNYLRTYRVPATYTVPCGDLQERELDGLKIECQAGFFEVPLPEKERVITSRQLLGHLGGIMHYGNGKGSPHPPQRMADDPGTNTGMAWALDYLFQRPLVSRPGTAFHYSTFGFNLLGVVLEEAGGLPFPEQIRQRISEPLGLKTLQPDYEWVDIPNRAVGYQRRGAEITRQSSNDVSWKLAGGGFISTVEDLAGYCRGLMGNSLLSPEEKKELWTSQKTADGKPTGYGLGFGVGEFRGHRQVAHSGGQQKTRTHLRLLPDDGICVVAMTNSAYGNPQEITEGVTEILVRRKGLN